MVFSNIWKYVFWQRCNFWIFLHTSKTATHAFHKNIILNPKESAISRKQSKVIELKKKFTKKLKQIVQVRWKDKRCIHSCNLNSIGSQNTRCTRVKCFLNISKICRMLLTILKVVVFKQSSQNRIKSILLKITLFLDLRLIGDREALKMFIRNSGLHPRKGLGGQKSLFWFFTGNLITLKYSKCLYTPPIDMHDHYSLREMQENTSIVEVYKTSLFTINKCSILCSLCRSSRETFIKRFPGKVLSTFLTTLSLNWNILGHHFYDP